MLSETGPTLVRVTGGPSLSGRAPVALLGTQGLSLDARQLERVAEALLGAAGIEGQATAREGCLSVPCPRPDLAPVIAAALRTVIGAPAGARPAAVRAATGALLATWWNPREAALLARAAGRRAIPARWPAGDGRHLALGHGRFRRHYRHGYFDGDPTRDTTDDKLATADAIAALGIRTTAPRPVRDPAEARAVAERLGRPVVLKPRHGAAQHAMFVGLRGADAVERAARRACAQLGGGDTLIAEAHVPGVYLRATTIGGRLAAALASEAPRAVGDGCTRAGSLAGRALGFATDFAACPPEGRAHIANVLAAQDLSPDDRVGPGVVFDAGYSSDGPPADATAGLHAGTRAALERIAARFPAPVLGIDLILPDPAADVNLAGAVLEVNSAPGFAMHEEAAPGAGAHLADRVLQALFPGPCRLPVVAVNAGARRPVERLLTLAADADLVAGGLFGDSAWIGAPSRPLGGDGSPERLLDRADCDLIVLAVSAPMARTGLPLDRIDFVAGDLGDGELAGCVAAAGAVPLDPGRLVAAARRGLD